MPSLVFYQSFCKCAACWSQGKVRCNLWPIQLYIDQRLRYMSKSDVSYQCSGLYGRVNDISYPSQEWLLTYVVEEAWILHSHFLVIVLSIYSNSNEVLEGGQYSFIITSTHSGLTKQWSWWKTSSVAQYPPPNSAGILTAASSVASFPIRPNSSSEMRSVGPGKTRFQNQQLPWRVVHNLPEPGTSLSQASSNSLRGVPL